MLTEQNPSRGLGPSGISGGVALLDSVERDIRAHVKEIESKILTIVDNLLGGQISKWTARPPIPSKSFRNISRYVLHSTIVALIIITLHTYIL